MSIEAMKWAVEFAPPMPSQLVATLTGLAYHADKRGRGAYPSVARLAALACKDKRSVQRDIKALRELGLIRLGNQSLAAHLPEGKRPEVYDLAMERVIAGGRAGSDEAARTSRATLASSRRRGGRKKPTSDVFTSDLTGDVDVTGDADATGGVDVPDGVTSTSQNGRRPRHPNPKDEPSYEPNDAHAIVPATQSTVAAPDLPDRMAEAFMARFARGNTYRLRPVRRVIADALTRETDPRELWEALLWLGKTSRNISDGALQFAFAKVRNPQDTNVLPMRPSTADLRAAEALRLADKFRAEAEAQQRALEAAPVQDQEPA